MCNLAFLVKRFVTTARKIDVIHTGIPTRKMIHCRWIYVFTVQ